MHTTLHITDDAYIHLIERNFMLSDLIASLNS